jgi:hypothetical protein
MPQIAQRATKERQLFFEEFVATFLLRHLRHLRSPRSLVRDASMAVGQIPRLARDYHQTPTTNHEKRRERHAPAPSRGGFVDELSIPLDFGFGGLDRARQRQILVPRDLTGVPPRAKNGISQALRGPICLAGGAKHLEAQAPLIECVLSDATRTIELCSYTIPKSHSALAVSRFRRQYAMPEKRKPPQIAGASKGTTR